MVSSLVNFHPAVPEKRCVVFYHFLVTSARCLKKNTRARNAVNLVCNVVFVSKVRFTENNSSCRRRSFKIDGHITPNGSQVMIIDVGPNWARITVISRTNTARTSDVLACTYASAIFARWQYSLGGSFLQCADVFTAPNVIRKPVWGYAYTVCYRHYATGVDLKCECDASIYVFI